MLHHVEFPTSSNLLSRAVTSSNAEATAAASVASVASGSDEGKTIQADTTAVIACPEEGHHEKSPSIKVAAVEDN